MSLDKATADRVLSAQLGVFERVYTKARDYCFRAGGATEEVALGIFNETKGAIARISDALNVAAGFLASIANPMESDLDAGGFKISDLAEPVADDDAATKKYVDDNGGGGTPAWPVAGDANGGTLELRTHTEVLTTPASGTADVTGASFLLPGDYVFDLSWRVLTTVGADGVAQIQVGSGISKSADYFGYIPAASYTAGSAGSSADYTAKQGFVPKRMSYFGTDNSPAVVLTLNGDGPWTASGTIRVTVYYYRTTPSTS